MNLYCPKCGAPVTDSQARFCSRCGHNFAEKIEEILGLVDDDEFSSVEIDDTEALAFTDDSESDTSSWLKNSIILFIYALLF